VKLFSKFRTADSMWAAVALGVGFALGFIVAYSECERARAELAARWMVIGGQKIDVDELTLFLKERGK
jgi:hypothetical protein